MTRTFKTILALTLLIPLTIPQPAQGNLKKESAPRIIHSVQSEHKPSKPRNQTKPIIIPPEAALFEYVPYHFDPIGTHPNAFEPGQCTYGAASMKGNIPWSGNANQWDDNARAMGYTVSSTPIVGSVAVDNSGYYGHVAVVTAVGDGTVTVTEMNYDWNGGVRSYTYPVGHFVYIYI